MIKNKQKSTDVFFSQKAPAGPWTSQPYWDGTVEDQGCGMISLTMCINILKETDYTPSDIIDMRSHAGLDQHHVFNKETLSVCGGDVHPSLNEIYAELFGIKSQPLERTLDAFKDALAQENTVIWASSDGLVFQDVNGVPTDRKAYMGHVIVIWKYENGFFYVKDCHYQKDLGNNVPYSEEKMLAFINQRKYQQYAITTI